MQFTWATLLLASSALALPASTNVETKTQQLIARDFDFHASYTFTTPAHQNSWGYVNFGLYNPNTNYVPSCNASSNQLSDFFYGNFVYRCNDPSGHTSTFTFSRPNNELKVNQTWACGSGNSVVTARAGALLNLDCKDVKWQNPNWTPGQIYSTRTITCQRAHQTLPINDISLSA